MTTARSTRSPQWQCPRCGGRRYWLLKDGRRRCANCRADWRASRVPLYLTPREWRDLLRWFVLGLPGRQIALETGLERKRVLRALTIVRLAIAAESEVPRAQDARRPERTSEHPVIGLSVERGRAAAEVVQEPDASEVRRAIRERRRPELTAGSAPRRYAAIVHRGQFYRLRAPERNPVAGFGGLESFWAYLRQRLRSKGGVRRERLNLYLAEYAWRYNRRSIAADDQAQELFALVRASAAEGARMGLSRGPRDTAADR